jgi:hypothetical protein
MSSESSLLDDAQNCSSGAGASTDGTMADSEASTSITPLILFASTSRVKRPEGAIRFPDSFDRPRLFTRAGYKEC